MSDLPLSSGLVHHFSQRLKQYLLFLQFASDSELMQLFLSFLDLNDLLHFLVTSSHFYELRKTQSIEVRLLRAKIAYYEKPKATIGYDPFAFFLPYRMLQRPEKNVQKMRDEHKSLIKFNQGIRFFKYLKKEGVIESKESFQKMLEKKGFAEFSKFYDEFHKEDLKLEEKLMKPEVKQLAWAKVGQNELEAFQQYKEYFQEKNAARNEGKKIIEYNANTSRLEAMEHRLAKQDYQRRKMKKIKTKEEMQFIPLEEFKKFAEKDPCSQQIYNRVFEEEKAKKQRQNVSKLRMRPPPSIKQIILQQSLEQPKPPKQSIAVKMFSGIKSLFLPNKP